MSSAGGATLGAVVAGTGFGCVTHVRALRAAGFGVLAVIGRDPARTTERARAFGVAHACTSLAEAMALPGVDALTVATPPNTHAELALAAIQAGRHVICEKPFAAMPPRVGPCLRQPSGLGSSTCSATTSVGIRARRPWPGPSPPATSASRGWQRSCFTSVSSPIPPPRSRRGGPTLALAAAGWGRTDPR